MKRKVNELLKSIMSTQGCSYDDAIEWLDDVVNGLKEDASERHLQMNDFRMACQDLEVDYDHIDILIELVFE